MLAITQQQYPPSLAGSFAAKQVLVDGVAVQVVAANDARLKLKLSSTGNKVIYLGKDAAVTVADGFALGKEIPEEFDRAAGSTLEWWAISNGMGGILTVAEFFE